MARSFLSAMNQIARAGARAHRQHLRELQAQAREAERQARASERAARTAEREFLRQRKEADKEAKRRYLEARKQEAEDMTTDVQAKLAELDGVLAATLKVNDAIDFTSLYPKDTFPSFKPPKAEPMPSLKEPRKEDFFVAVRMEPGLFEKLLGVGQKARMDAISAAEEKFSQAMAGYQSSVAAAEEVRRRNGATLASARTKYEAEKTTFEADLARRRAEVDDFKAKYQAGDKEAVEAYCSMVLERSDYEDLFQLEHSVAYVASSKELVVEMELPTLDVVPEDREYRYVQSRDDIQSSALKPKERSGYYERLVASIALRSLHEIFEADVQDHVASVVINGMVSTIDRATGTPVRPCLITLQATKEEFSKFDLSQVDVIACVRKLKAHVSPAMAELAPVKPIVEFSMVDRRFVQETDVVSSLDARPNLLEMDPFEFEHLICNLFSRIGLEAKLTRSSRDGGVDVIAFDPRPVFGGKYVIQAKRYRNTVEISAVRDLYGTMMNENASKGILVTTSTYGPDARSFAKDKPIELIDGSHLLYLLEQQGIHAKIVIPGS